MPHRYPITDRFSKQPAESYFISVDFSLRLAEGETLLSAGSTITATDKADQDVSTTVLQAGSHVIGDDLVQVFVKGGVDGQDYKITLSINSSNGSKYEHDILMMVRAE